MKWTDWIKRRWMDFRYGHNVYLAFFLGFAQFILIVYNFVPIVNRFVSINMFIFLFITMYIPLAIIIGHLHIRHLVPTESAVGAEKTPYREKILKGKEEMSNQYLIQSIDYNLLSIKVSLKSMEIWNYMLSKSSAPSNLLFTETEMNKYKRWLTVFEDWRNKFLLLQQGYSASEIMGEADKACKGGENG